MDKENSPSNWNSWDFKFKHCIWFGIFLLLQQRCLAARQSTHQLSSNRCNGSSPNSTRVYTGIEISLDKMTDADKMTQKSAEEPWVQNLLLPKDVEPELYNLYLFPHLSEGEFEGAVDITVKVTEPRNHLILHSLGLNIHSTHVTKMNESTAVEISRTFDYTKNQFWVIQLCSVISPGQYIISLKFSGKLTGKNVGFYRSSYKDDAGNTRYIATTKFEPTYARQAFPCFDEPILKARYNVRLVRPSYQYVALSNMNVIAEKEDSPLKGFTTVEFGTTPPMSTYYTCFIVCDFHTLKPVILENNVTLNVYAQPSQIKNMQFTRDFAAKAMHFYTNYFEIPYPLPKLDLIAIPDFVSGAMENWGLVTFRETMVLITEGESNTANYEQVAGTVAHELAHMWFGDLVTMAWWDDLWLNEGFATFLTIICVQNVLPEWESEAISLLKNRFIVMADDAALSSHAIIQNVSHPDQITEIFDAISYRKGSSVLVMLESLGPEKFRKGVSSYLKYFQYSNSKTEDLWSFIEKEMDHFNVSKVMGTWTKQMGYPLVTVAEELDKLVFSQQRFLADKDSSYPSDSSPFGYKWDIPITYITSKLDNAVHFFLNSNETHVQKILEPGTEWFKVNLDLKGFYRVNYSEAYWKKLDGIFKNNSCVLNAANRANILDDAFSLAQSGYLNYSIPLSFIGYIKNKSEVASVPLMVISRHLNNLKVKLFRTESYSSFKKYIQTLVEPLISEDMWEIKNEDSFEVRRVKITLLLMACRFEIPSVLSRARTLFSGWLEGKTDKPHAEIRSLVYNYGIDGENVKHNWEKLWDVYLNETNPEEKLKFRRSLASVNSEELITKLLELAKDENYVRAQDYFPFLSAIADNPNGVQILWDFIRNEWNYLVNRFTLNDRYLGRIVPIVTEDFSTEAQLEEVKAFFLANPDAGAGANGRKHALETIENNIKWNKKNLPDIESWLSRL